MTVPIPLIPQETVRVRLARVALDAALAVDGVAAGDAGANRLHVMTAGTGEQLIGIRAAAEPGGGYAVDLGLKAGLVALEALGETVRAAVRVAAVAAGLGAELGPVAVTVHDVADPDEEMALAFAVALGEGPGAVGA